MADYYHFYIKCRGPGGWGVPPGFTLLAAFDWSDAAQQTWEDAQDPNQSGWRNSAAQAIANIDSFLAVADTATAVQVRTAVKGLAKITRAMLLRLLDIE